MTTAGRKAKVIDVLKEACLKVHAGTKGLAGTARGSRQMGRGAGGDISTKADLVAERAVISLVRKRGIGATIIGEECGTIEGSGGFIVMDAIDGTTNATRRIPFYCCSLAYATDFRLSSVTDAVIIDLARGDLYYASKGRGAFANGRRITTARKNSYDGVVGLNVSGVGADVVSRLAPVIAKTRHVRHFGANALELCLLASGALDAFIDFRGKIRPTDMAAAYLIVKEAGARFYNDRGSELDSSLDINSRFSFVAATDVAFRELGGDLFGKA